jgi:hypothetical protein
VSLFKVGVSWDLSQIIKEADKNIGTAQ